MILVRETGIHYSCVKTLAGERNMLLKVPPSSFHWRERERLGMLKRDGSTRGIQTIVCFPSFLIFDHSIFSHIKNQTHYFANKGPSSQGYGFSSSQVWM